MINPKGIINKKSNLPRAQEINILLFQIDRANKQMSFKYQKIERFRDKSVILALLKHFLYEA